MLVTYKPRARYLHSQHEMQGGELSKDERGVMVMQTSEAGFSEAESEDAFSVSTRRQSAMLLHVFVCMTLSRPLRDLILDLV